jgi:hypothetical protein
MHLVVGLYVNITTSKDELFSDINMAIYAGDMQSSLARGILHVQIGAGTDEISNAFDVSVLNRKHECRLAIIGEAFVRNINSSASR